MMENNIKTLPSGNTFVISALLPEDYYNCNKPEQTQLAKALKKYASIKILFCFECDLVTFCDCVEIIRIA